MEAALITAAQGSILELGPREKMRQATHAHSEITGSHILLLALGSTIPVAQGPTMS